MKLHLPATLLASFFFLSICNSSNAQPSDTTLKSHLIPTISAQATPKSITSNWYKYTPADGSYTALFPGQPQETSKPESTAPGEITTFMAFYGDSNTAYLTTSYKLSIKIPYNLAKIVLDSGEENLLTSLNATLINKKNITLNGYPGRELTASLNKDKDVLIKVRFFVNTETSTLHQILVMARDGNIYSPKATAFLDSLTIK
jgi:hypothetical protein